MPGTVFIITRTGILVAEAGAATDILVARLTGSIASGDAAAPALAGMTSNRITPHLIDFAIASRWG